MDEREGLIIQTEDKEPRPKLSPKIMLTVDEVAAAIHVHPNTIRHWNDRGLLKAYRVGPRRDRRFRWEDVDSFINHWNGGLESGSSGKGKVLIVDDNPRIRNLLKDIVRQQGYKAIAVQSGERAVKQIEKQQFDLIFLDLELPGLSGLEVFQLIKGTDPRAIVAVVTGLGDEDLLPQLMSKGSFFMIRKPFEVADIIQVLHAVIPAHRKA